jgi:hypothetical protein
MAWMALAQVWMASTMAVWLLVTTFRTSFWSSLVVVR